MKKIMIVVCDLFRPISFFYQNMRQNFVWIFLQNRIEKAE